MKLPLCWFVCLSVCPQSLYPTWHHCKKLTQSISLQSLCCWNGLMAIWFIRLSWMKISWSFIGQNLKSNLAKFIVWKMVWVTYRWPEGTSQALVWLYLPLPPLIFQKRWLCLSCDMWPHDILARAFQCPRNQRCLCAGNNKVPSSPQTRDYGCPGPYITWNPTWMEYMCVWVEVCILLWWWWDCIPSTLIQHCSKLFTHWD